MSPYDKNGTGHSPQYTKNGSGHDRPILVLDSQFPEWAKGLTQTLREALPKLTLGIEAIQASVNHHANAAHYNADKAKDLLDWFHREQAKALDLKYGKEFGPAQRALATSNLDDRVLDMIRTLLHSTHHPAFDNLATEAQKAADAHATATAVAAAKDEAPPMGNIGSSFSRTTVVLHGLLQHFAPRGATGIAFLIVDVMNRLQDVMAATLDNKPPSTIAQLLSSLTAACENIGPTTMTLGQLCGIVSAAVLASSDSPLSETGNRLLSGLADSLQLHATEGHVIKLDVTTVATAVHQRRQVLDHAGLATKNHGFLGTTADHPDRPHTGTADPPRTGTADHTDRPPMPTSPPDSGREWAWGTVSHKWYQRKIAATRPTTPTYKTAAMHAGTDIAEAQFHEAAAEAAQMGRSTFMVDDRAFRIDGDTYRELVA